MGGERKGRREGGGVVEWKGLFLVFEVKNILRYCHLRPLVLFLLFLVLCLVFLVLLLSRSRLNKIRVHFHFPLLFLFFLPTLLHHSIVVRLYFP